MTNQLYPIASVAAELNIGYRELERRCNGNVVRDDALMKCIPAHLVRELIVERDAADLAEREARRQAAANRQPNPHRERVRAIQAAQRANPVDPLGTDMSMQQRALGTVTASDIGERVDASEERLSDFMSGELRVRRFTNRKARG